MADEFFDDDEQPECPLCMEPLGVDDLNFFPCICRYQICRFCWHRIRTDENGLCPACREPYAEDPAEYTPPSQEQIAKLKSQKRQKSHDKKQKLVESRRTLADVRVVQKNLVFVIGLSSRLADPETLKRQDCFGKYGKIHKVVINHSTVYNGAQGPSVSAYVTYYRSEDAKKAIHNVNNAYIDGRFLKASFGTTKYCSHFLRGLQCPKPDCMYLHELGDEDASFTKQDMLLGKHQDYEQATLSAFSQAMNVSVTHKQPVPVREETSTTSHHRSAATNSGGWKRSQPPRMKQKARNDQQQQNHHQQQQQQQQQLYDAESALPSSALWAKQQESESVALQGYRQQHTSSKHSKHLQRTHSHPVTTHTQHRSSSHAHSNPNSRRGSKGSDGSREDSSSSSSSKLGSPADSFCSSIESLKNLTVSSGGGDRTIEEEYQDEEEDVFTSNGVTQEESSDGSSCPHDMVTDSSAAKRDESIGVLQNFGSAMSGGFGGLGVSWHGQVPVRSTTILEETQSSWGHRRVKEGRDNEQKRIASAAYVNYGPTTNNVLAELAARESNLQHEGGGPTAAGRMLQSSLDDKFNAIYTVQQQQSAFQQQQQSAFQQQQQQSAFQQQQQQQSAFQQQQQQSAFQQQQQQQQSAFQQQQQQSAFQQQQPTSSGWSPFNRPQDHGTSIPPPPGFAPQTREPPPVKTKEANMVLPAASSRYSLWGSSSTSVEPVQTSQPAATQRVIPGAIQHSVLEASLFSNWSQNYYPSYQLAPPLQTATGLGNTGLTNGFSQPLQQQQPHATQSAYLPWNGLSGLGVLAGSSSSDGAATAAGLYETNQLAAAAAANMRRR